MRKEEIVMSRIWGRIITEVRKLRAEKYTLERIGNLLGVAKPTVQRWLENSAGGEKTAFIDILRYMDALNIDLQELMFGKSKSGTDNTALLKELAELKKTKQELANELLLSQREHMQAQQTIIGLQGRLIELEKQNAEISEKAKVALLTVKSVQKAPATNEKRRVDPSLFPDLPPIHLQFDDK